MLTELLTLLAGLVLILAGANFLVEGSSNIARKLGISEFIIGLTIVGIGTSAPEMVVSFVSAAKGNADMAVGNIIGSNIFNTLLILGVTALISPLAISRSTRKRDIPVNIAATLLLLFLGLDGTIFGSAGGDILGRIDGVILLLVFVAYLYTAFKNDTPEEPRDDKDAERKSKPAALYIVLTAAGLAGLIWGGNLFVESATKLAKSFGVPDAFIAITLMAGGTSLPELATCIVAAAKGKGQLALGNVLGSNISNILLILGGSALITPLSLGGMTPVDLGTVLLCAVFILLSAYLFKKDELDRTEGVILLLMEAAYFGWLLYANI